MCEQLLYLRQRILKVLCAVLIAGLFELSRDTDLGVALYSRRVLIKSKTDNILPKWLRFVKGKSQSNPSVQSTENVHNIVIKFKCL